MLLICFIFLLLAYVALLPTNDNPESIVDPFYYMALYGWFFAAIDLCMLCLLWKRGVLANELYGKYIVFEACTMNLACLIMGFFYLYMGNRGVDEILADNTDWYACL